MTDLQRGVHRDFELVVICCDTLPELRVYYDRVAGEVRVETGAEGLRPQAAAAVSRFQPGTTLESCTADEGPVELIFKTKGLVHIREYLVSGPPALMLDLSCGVDLPAQLPFELGRNDYLLRGGIEEREGRLETALKYINRVRQIGPDETALEHRAGIMQHRLGRWDEALETFARTAGADEFAADAHARRAMIYLAKGDTTASGTEWSDYFHDRHLVASGEQEARGAEPPAPGRKREPLLGAGSMPAVLSAGAGENMYLGLGLLVAGIIALTTLFISTGRGGAVPLREAAAGGYYPGEPPQPRYSFTLPRFAGAAYHGTSPGRASVFGGVPRPEPVVQLTELEVAAPVSAPFHAGGRHPFRSIPSELVIQRAEVGVGELDIARECGMGRDEVAMILNLARLAQKGRGESAA